MPDFFDIESRITRIGAALPSVRRQNWLDVVMLALVALLGASAIVSVLSHTMPAPARYITVIGLVVIAFIGAYTRMVSRTDHVRALQSDRMLKVANESTSFMRLGLDIKTAGEVCRIVLRETEAAAVAITDRETVLGFAGVGEDHHLVGGPIITRATQEAVDQDESRVLHTREEIGCPRADCRLKAAIVAPLEQRGKAVGTLKFYYTSDRYLNETQLAMAEGLARLLSTQLEFAELERQAELATVMELRALQAQINPHFLFNTINTIASFIRTDPEEARLLLRRFATFYRHTLDDVQDLVVLKREVEFVETYVGLEKARFGERLEVVFDIDEKSEQFRIPAFMIQPLVENAIAHGMRADGSPLHVRVRARREGEMMCISVADDGAGIPADRLERIFEPKSSKGLGIALPNVRDRLRGHFGAESQLVIESVLGEGTTVTLHILITESHASGQRSAE